MPDFPVSSVLGYVGVIFSMAGLFILLVGQEVIKVEKISV